MHVGFFTARKIAPPLEINGLPGYEQLSSTEREVGFVKYMHFLFS